MPKMKVKMPKEEQQMVEIASKLGSIYYSQMAQFFPHLDNNRFTYYMKYLYENFFLDICEQDVIIPFGRPGADHDTIDCMWPVIDNIANIGGISHIDRAESPSSVFYYDLNGALRECVRIKPENAYRLEVLQNRYRDRFGEDMDSGEIDYRYVLVIDNEKMIDVISKYNLQIPNVIALINPYAHEPHEISYYKDT